MNKGISIAGLVIAVAALGLTTWFSFSGRKDKTGYVLLSDIYEQFELSKEMKVKFEALELKRNSLLDSIKYNVMVAEKQKLKELDYYKQAYYYKSEEFDKSNHQVREQFDEQIWKQVNQYIEEYGKEHGYVYIYGATGNGSLMYGKREADITKDVVEYINKKYKGKSS